VSDRQTDFMISKAVLHYIAQSKMENQQRFSFIATRAEANTLQLDRFLSLEETTHLFTE